MENEVLNYEYEQNNPLEIKPAENVVMGILGALVGAVLGGACIILLSQIGYIASISGFVLAFCTLKGYELLAKGMSTKGIVICLILMILTPFVADWLDWGILFMRELPEYGFSLLDWVLLLPTLLAEDSELMGEYLKNLGMLYLFVVLGGFYSLKEAFKRR